MFFLSYIMHLGLQSVTPCPLWKQHCTAIKASEWAVAVPYYCAQGNQTKAISECLADPDLVDVHVLVKAVHAFAEEDLISDHSNMMNDPVFIFHGMNDSMVMPGKYAVFMSCRLNVSPIYSLITAYKNKL